MNRKYNSHYSATEGPLDLFELLCVTQELIERALRK